MQLLLQKQPVCVEIESFTTDLSEYRFVVLTVLLKLVDDPAERSEAIEKIAAIGGKRLSGALLATHGPSPEQDWSALTKATDVVIVRLDRVIYTLGLKPALIPRIGNRLRTGC